MNLSEMNFAKAVKGALSENYILREIDSQSEIELGRHLGPAEKSSLFTKCSPQLIFDRIQQVLSRNIIYFFNFCFLVWLWCFEVFGVSV